MNDESLVRGKDILSILGYADTSASEEILAMAERIAAESGAMLEPKYTIQIVPIQEVTDTDVRFASGERFTYRPLADALRACSHAVLTAITVGGEIDEAVKREMDTGDPLTGMMLDAAGTAAVNRYSRSVWTEITARIRKEYGDDMGITRGFSPGSNGWELTDQQPFFRLLDAAPAGITLTPSCLMIPYKSVSVAYGIGRGIGIDRSEHACDMCPIANCPMRTGGTLKLTVNRGERTAMISAKRGENLLTVLRDNDISVEAQCAGRGVCGSCKAQFFKFLPDVTAYDRQHLTEAELAQGWRLTCRVTVEHPLELTVPQVGDMVILKAEGAEPRELPANIAPGVAVDIGTTTVVAHLVNQGDGAILDSVGELNAQRPYGADVASRIQYAAENPGGAARLHTVVTQQLSGMIHTLLARYNISPEQVQEVVTVGNTVMAHLLLGYDPTSLGTAPYTPVSLDRATKPCRALGVDCGGEMTMLEGIAAYVGSDVAVGAALMEMMASDRYTILLDLGTNGEIVLGSARGLTCCSTAAGPAFEGVNIQCGTGGVPGAVASCAISGKGSQAKLSFETIGHKPPVGICGSGVLDIVAALVKAGVVDATGRMQAGSADNPLVKENAKFGRHVVLHEKAEIVFTQKDVREVQLAKAAVAAGVRILLRQAKIDLRDIGTLYVAGGFGNFMNVESALAIGLLPAQLRGRIQAVGNTAGRGAAAAVAHGGFKNRVAGYVRRAAYIDLASDAAFQDAFIDEMGFDNG